RSTSTPPGGYYAPCCPARGRELGGPATAVRSSGGHGSGSVTCTTTFTEPLEYAAVHERSVAWLCDATFPAARHASPGCSPRTTSAPASAARSAAVAAR